MKKVIVLLTVIILLLTMVSCTGNYKGASETPSKSILGVEVNSEKTYINEVYVGITYSYENYYLFSAVTYSDYLLFLDEMYEKIEIIDISLYDSYYRITYRLPTTNN